MFILTRTLSSTMPNSIKRNFLVILTLIRTRESFSYRINFEFSVNLPYLSFSRLNSGDLVEFVWSLSY